MANDDQVIKYAVSITSALGQLFEEGSEFEIDQDELQEGDNLTDFIHALANVVPTQMYNQITGDNKNQLLFNHVANQLCFQYSKKD